MHQTQRNSASAALTAELVSPSKTTITAAIHNRRKLVQGALRDTATYTHTQTRMCASKRIEYTRFHSTKLRGELKRLSLSLSLTLSMRVCVQIDKCSVRMYVGISLSHQYLSPDLLPGHFVYTHTHAHTCLAHITHLINDL